MPSLLDLKLFQRLEAEILAVSPEDIAKYMGIVPLAPQAPPGSTFLGKVPDTLIMFRVAMRKMYAAYTEERYAYLRNCAILSDWEIDLEAKEIERKFGTYDGLQTLYLQALMSEFDIREEGCAIWFDHDQNAYLVQK